MRWNDLTEREKTNLQMEWVQCEGYLNGEEYNTVQEYFLARQSEIKYYIENAVKNIEVRD